MVQSAGRSALGAIRGASGSVAEAGIIVTARERTGAAFARVSKNVGGMGGSFIRLGAILLRLLGPVFLIATAFTAVAAVLSSIGVVLTSKPWLEWEQASRKAENTMRLMNITQKEQNSLLSELERKLGRTNALRLLGGNQQAFRGLALPENQDFVTSILPKAARLEELTGVAASDFATAYILALEGETDRLLVLGEEFGLKVTDALGNSLEAPALFAEWDRFIEAQKDVDLTNIEKLGDQMGRIGEGLIGIFGPIGNIIATVILPFVAALAVAVEVIVALVDTVKLIINGFVDLFTRNWFTEGPFSPATIQAAKDLISDLFGFFLLVFLDIPVAMLKVGVKFMDAVITMYENLREATFEAVRQVTSVLISTIGSSVLWNSILVPFGEGMAKIGEFFFNLLPESLQERLTSIFDFMLVNIEKLIGRMEFLLALLEILNTRPSVESLDEAAKSFFDFLDKLPSIPGFGGDPLGPFRDLIEKLREGLDPTTYSGGVAFAPGAGTNSRSLNIKVDLQAEGRSLTDFTLHVLNDEIVLSGGASLV